MLAELQKKIKYSFSNMELLKNSLIHKSHNEGLQRELPDNERLEFLGDSVINLIVTDYLYQTFTHIKEGELSKLKAHLISTSFLFNIAKSINLEKYIYLGKGEEKNLGRKNKKIIASLFEAVVGAIYADSNFNTAFTKIFPFFKTFLDTILEKNLRVNDYKSELQEIIQKDNENHPEYKIIKERQEMSGRIFRTIVTSRGKEIGVGEGKNKREAEQNAAYDALLKINSNIKYKKLSEVFFIKDD